MVEKSQADLVLENGAEVEFKVANDASGNPVVTSLQISFPKSMRIPNGGIGAAQLREIGINQLLAIWFVESSRSSLTRQQEGKILHFISNASTSGGRNGLPDRYYACLAYLYVKNREKSPSNPTAVLAKELAVSAKTISTRLTRARKLGVLTPTKSKVSTGRAGGELTSKGRKLISDVLEEKK
jgi:hypothetical protein